MPTLYIIAGPNGSGKTTLARELAETENLDFLNADDIARSINPQDVSKAYMQAGREFFRKMNELLAARKSIVMETTLSGKYHNRLIEKFKRNGYEIKLYFVFLDNPQICIQRIKNRVLKGGHNVPDDDVIRRFFRSKQNFMVLRKIVSCWELYYNGGNEFTLIAHGKEHYVNVVNDFLYDNFVGGNYG
ncbi:MAG: zeta toxin family protein [Fibromonadaceae bacterium]|jgi:predicted ABC-type ATPase|nr:zeta toxin family protein [Fibromonadaceae bacterium]